MKRIFSSFLIIVVLFSCNTDDDSTEVDNIFLGYNYFPLELNQEQQFQIDSIIYDDFTGRIDTFSHQRKEIVELQLDDVQERLSFAVGIYERFNDTLAWVKKKQIVRTKTNRRIEELNENLRKVVMIFPITEKGKWNSNVLNTSDEEQYFYTEINDSATVKNIFFDSTLTIQQRLIDNLIEQISTHEVYSINEGLVYREDINLETKLNGDIVKGYKAIINKRIP